MIIFMNKDEKIIEYLLQHKNNLWTGVIVLSGGLAGLLLTYPNVLFVLSIAFVTRIILIILGAFFLILMIIGLINTSSDIQRLIK